MGGSLIGTAISIFRSFEREAFVRKGEGGNEMDDRKVFLRRRSCLCYWCLYI